MVIVIDDGQEYDIPDDPRITVVADGIKSGPNAARNRGLAHCTGDILLPLDADDWMAPTRIEKLAPLARKFGVAGDQEITRSRDSGTIEREVFEPLDRQRWLSPKDYLELNATIHLVFRRAVTTEWPESVALAGDTVFNLDAIERAGQLVIYPETLFEYRTHNESHCHASDGIEKAERGYQRILELIDQRVIARGDLLNAYARQIFGQKRETNRAYGQYVERHGLLHLMRFCSIDKSNKPPPFRNRHEENCINNRRRPASW